MLYRSVLVNAAVQTEEKKFDAMFFFLKFTDEMLNSTIFFFSFLKHTSDVSQIP